MAGSRRTISRLSATARGETKRRSTVRVRRHRIVIDDAVERGGTDRGPNPPETLLTALAGCLNLQLRRISDEAGIALSKVTVSIDADFDRRAVTWNEDVATPFPRIRVDIGCSSAASATRIKRLRKPVLERCPVSRVLLESGSKFDVRWDIRALKR